MDEELYRSGRKAILDALFQRNKWGESHTPYKRMFSSLPNHLRGEKEVKRAAADLIKEGKILVKQTTGDDHVSLNSALAKEIKRELGYLDNI